HNPYEHQDTGCDHQPDRNDAPVCVDDDHDNCPRRGDRENHEFVVLVTQPSHQREYCHGSNSCCGHHKRELIFAHAHVVNCECTPEGHQHKSTQGKQCRCDETRLIFLAHQGVEEVRQCTAGLSVLQLEVFGHRLHSHGHHNTHDRCHDDDEIER